MKTRSDLAYLAVLGLLLAALSVYGRRLQDALDRELAEIEALEAIPVLSE